MQIFARRIEDDNIIRLRNQSSRNRSTLIDKQQENENDPKHFQETDFHYRKITQKPD